MNNKDKVIFSGIVFILLVILLTANTIVSIDIMRTDLSIVKSQNRILQNDIDLLRVEQEKLSSRQKYSVTVTEMAMVMKKLEQNQQDMSSINLKLNAWDGLIKVLCGGE